MSSKLQLDISNYNQWRRRLVNAYEVETGMVLFAGKTVWFGSAFGLHHDKGAK